MKIGLDKKRQMIDKMLYAMALYERFSDDENIITGSEMLLYDAVVEKSGDAIRYGMYLHGGVAYGVEIVGDQAIHCYFRQNDNDDMPMRTIFETEGYAWRQAMMCEDLPNEK